MESIKLKRMLSLFPFLFISLNQPVFAGVELIDELGLEENFAYCESFSTKKEAQEGLKLAIRSRPNSGVLLMADSLDSLADKFDGSYPNDSISVKTNDDASLNFMRYKLSKNKKSYCLSYIGWSFLVEKVHKARLDILTLKPHQYSCPIRNPHCTFEDSQIEPLLFTNEQIEKFNAFEKILESDKIVDNKILRNNAALKILLSKFPELDSTEEPLNSIYDINVGIPIDGQNNFDSSIPFILEISSIDLKYSFHAQCFYGEKSIECLRVGIPVLQIKRAGDLLSLTLIQRDRSSTPMEYRVDIKSMANTGWLGIKLNPPSNEASGENEVESSN